MIQSTPAPRRRAPQPHILNVLPGVILSLIMVWSVVRSIAVARWGPDLEILISVALPALLTGAIFARVRRLPIWGAHLLSAALGLAWTITRLDPLLDARLTTWRDQATELLIRTIIWVRVLVNGGRGEDIVLFVTVLALLSWMLGYSTAWFIFRRGWTWLALLVNAGFILVNYVYVSPKPTTLFFVFLTSALLLLVYQNVINRQAQWAARDIEYPEFLSVRLVSAAALLSGLIIFGTSLLPSYVTSAQAEQTWQTMKQPFVLAREQWEDAFSTINSPPGTSGSSFTIRSSTLGGARVLGDDEVMRVQSPRFEYWRAVAFDRYSSAGWQNTTGEQARSLLELSTPEQARTALEANVPMPLNDVAARVVVTQTVELSADRKDDFVTVGGQAVEVSLPILVEHDYAVQQNRLTPNFDDTALIISRVPLRESTTYSVTALISVIDNQSLQQASTDYPEWVQSRYLQLPGTISRRTLDLTQEIIQTAGATTPYDQAIAIQNYLRTFPYNEAISAPPIGADPVDYFLFEQQEGYCDYYASAMVVMLRSLGVPARWVQGYAGGVYDFDANAYIVRENVAHSWPEIYFPEYGWQRFEPTPASYTSLPDRPETPPENGDEFAGLDLEEETFIPESPGEDPLTQEDTPAISQDLPVPTAQPGTTSLWQRLTQPASLVPLVLGVVAIGGYMLVHRRRRALYRMGPAAAAYAELGLLGRVAGLPQQPQTTPREYGATLEHALPQQSRAIRSIVDAYIHERYRRARSRRDFDAALQQVRWPLIRRRFTRSRKPRS